MDFNGFSKEIAGQLNIELKRLLQGWRKEIGNTDIKLLPLVDKFIASCRGGKRLRGILVVLGYEIGNSKLENKEIFKIAAAYEITHSSFLAHDDVIDQSPLRRGQPSLYQALGGNHYGVSQALSLGDAGFFLAMKIISESNFPDEEKKQAMMWFSETMLDTAMGEILDVEKGDSLTTAKLKTAKYSVSGPLVLGAILGGESLSSPRLRGIKKFGENLGIAFQIQDDILGVFGSEKEVGKSVTADIEEGKNTLLYNHALQKSNLEQRQRLDKYYGQGSQGVGEVRRVFMETGALDFAKKEAVKYKTRALRVLPEITKDEKMSEILEQLAESLIERSK